MILFHSILQAFSGLIRHKLRAILTMLGMVIGIATVTGMVSVSEGLTRVVIMQFERMGMGNMILIFRRDWVEGEDGVWRPNKSHVFLKYDDAKAVVSDCPSVKLVWPEIWEWTPYQAEWNGVAKQVTVRGSTPEYEEGKNWYAAKGRFLTQEDVDNEAMVCVIGEEIRKDVFKDEDPVGKELSLRGRRFRVVAVMEPKGDHTPDFTGTDNSLILPLTTFQRHFAGNDRINFFSVRAVSTDKVRQALLEVKASLARRRAVNPDEVFDFFTSDEIIRSVDRVSFILKAFLGGVASIALIVGGVGIMNMMLVSVTERTQEIGLRKAVGAFRRHVLYQFLVESIVLGAIGGTIGVLIGAAFGKTAAMIVSMVINRTGGPIIRWPAVVSFETAFMAMAISAGIGIVAGLFPAFRAAFIAPTEALRHE